MFLSRVLIDDHNRQKLKPLTHLGAYHDWVEQSFPDEFNRGERQRHLWRIDSLQGKRYLMVVSKDRPNLTMLERYGVTGTARAKDYQPFLDRIQKGELMRFRLVANPAYRHQGRTYPHITTVQQEEWLNQRAVDHGFELPTGPNGEVSFTVKNREWPRLYHGARGVRLSRVAFEGILMVTNVDAFRQTLVQGIGREKAYGMGLLTVIPLGKSHGE